MAASSASSTSPPLPSESLQPLTVILDTDSKAAADFFPFRDLASLNTGSSSSDSDSDDFSFRQLIEASVDGGQEILLFSSGCRLPGGETDCTRACNDTTTMFGSLETFYNCAALASISYWSRDDMAYFISDEAERNASSIMGNGTLARFEDRPVMQMFVGCALDSCRNDGLAEPCDETITSLSQDTGTREVLNAIENFCPAIQAEVNPDIFGPGVSFFCDRILTLLREATRTDIPRFSSRTSSRSASPSSSTSASRPSPYGSATRRGRRPTHRSPPSPASRP